MIVSGRRLRADLPLAAARSPAALRAGRGGLAPAAAPPPLWLRAGADTESSEETGERLADLASHQVADDRHDALLTRHAGPPFSAGCSCLLQCRGRGKIGRRSLTVRNRRASPRDSDTPW